MEVTTHWEIKTAEEADMGTALIPSSERRSKTSRIYVNFQAQVLIFCGMVDTRPGRAERPLLL